jgi:hypothetical protein
MIKVTYANGQFATMSEGPGWFDSGSDFGLAAPGTGASAIGLASFVTSPETITHGGSGLVFVNTYGAGVTATFRAEIIAAENYFQSHFTNACTINCSFDLQQLNPAYSGQNSFSPITVSYASLRAALTSHATSPDDVAAVNALANLSDPSGGQGFSVPIGEARILGLAGAGSGIDDAVVLNNIYWTAQALQNSPNDAIAVIEHEISEGAMGRIAGLGLTAPWAPVDLFRFTAGGQRDFTGGRDGLPTYFSPDGNNVATGLQFHNSINSQGQSDGFDLGDWDQVGADANALDPFGPGGPGVGDPGILSSTDLRLMDVLGWTRAPVVAADFNGKGISDILVENNTGNVTAFLMNNAAQILTAIGEMALPSGWTIQGIGDFNGDGTNDILVRNVSGNVTVFEMNNSGQIQSAIGVAAVATDWNIVGIGDFNGDGTSDILWENSVGNLSEFLMNSSGQVQSVVGVATLPSGWHVVGVGDFTGNHVSDILVENNSGSVSEFLMNRNGQVQSIVGVTTLPSGWHIEGVGDFNGDGISDILVRNDNGNVSAFLMNNSGHVQSVVGVASVTTDWSIAAIGDFNGDGISDIMWQNTNGNVSAYLMNSSGQVQSAVGVASLPGNWGGIAPHNPIV